MPLLPVLLLAAFALPAGALAAEEPPLDTHKARYSYLAGVQVGQSFRRDGVDIDPEIFAQAIADVLAGRELRLSRKELAEVVAERSRQVSTRRQELLAEKAAAEAAFLDEHAGREGVIVRPSGLQYEVLTPGTGPRPEPGSRVTVHYRGRLLDGTEFDSSHARGKPAAMDLSRVIPGWQEALPLMREGGRWTVVVPSALGYGEQGVGGVIGPNEPLIFEIELLEAAPPASADEAGASAPAAAR